MQTRCGVPSWNLGGTSMRVALQGAQKMPPHRRQWCRVRRRDLRQVQIQPYAGIIPPKQSTAACAWRCRARRRCRRKGGSGAASAAETCSKYRYSLHTLNKLPRTL